MVLNRVLGWLSPSDPPPPPRSFSPALESDETISQDQRPQLSKKAKRNVSKRSRTAQSQVSVEQQAEIDRKRERELEINGLKYELQVADARDERHKIELDEHCRENKTLRKTLEELDRENHNLTESLDERCRENKTLRKTLEELDRENHNLKASLDKHKQTIGAMEHGWQNLIVDRDRRIVAYDNELLKQQNSIVSLQQSGAVWAHRCEAAEKLVQQQVIDIQTLQREAENHRFHITELTGAILDSSEGPTTSRDDDYFSGEFARLAGAIRQWVLRYFDPRGVPELRCQDLPETIAKSLEEVIFGYKTIPDSKIKISRTEIEAVITQRLSALIFHSRFLFRIFLWPSMPDEAFTGITDLEAQKFRAQTADMLVKRSEFEHHFSEGVRMVTEELQYCFLSYAKPGMERSRLKVLYSIVEQAAKLEIEISRELSPFLVLQISPGTIYHPQYQDDRSGTVDSNDDDDDDNSDTDNTDEEGDEEVAEEIKDQVNKAKEKREAERRSEFTVGTVLFPPVLRWEFDSTGKIVESEIVVRKGIVIAIHSEIIMAESEQIESS